MVTDNSRRHLPPYVSYRTFINFINGLQQQIPSRIDRSYWGDMLSGSTGIQLMAALRFLGLIDSNGKPTDRLKSLASVTGEFRSTPLREVIVESYSFVLDSQLDIESATYAQLAEVFRQTFQIGDNVNHKCIKFFISIAIDAGVPLSPFITKKIRVLRSTTNTKSAVKKSALKVNRNLAFPQEKAGDTGGIWPEMLLAKFPAFDPAWNDEVKMKWFSAFDELLKRGSPPKER